MSMLLKLYVCCQHTHSEMFRNAAKTSNAAKTKTSKVNLVSEKLTFFAFLAPFWRYFLTEIRGSKSATRQRPYCAFGAVFAHKALSLSKIWPPCARLGCSFNRMPGSRVRR